jgi:uncharacterized protein YbjQ (UPF0145 family)
MTITTTALVPNKEIVEILGIARGSTVRAKHAGRDFLASFKSFFGGEILAYTELQEQSRNQAMERMIEEAKSLDADAVVNVRLTTAMIMQGTAEILAYGTAVKLK